MESSAKALCTELQINNNYNDHSICPFDLLAENLKDRYSTRLRQMYADFEAVRNEPDLYDETEFALPGCLFETFHNP